MMVQDDTSEELRCLSSLGHEELTDSELVLQAASILAPPHVQDMDICSAAPAHRRGSVPSLPSRDSSASRQSADSPAPTQLQQALPTRPEQPAGQPGLSPVKLESGTENQAPLAAPSAARPCTGHASSPSKAGRVPAVQGLTPEYLPKLPTSHPQVKQEATPTAAEPQATAEDTDGKGIKRNRTHQKDYTQRKRVSYASTDTYLPPSISVQSSCSKLQAQHHMLADEVKYDMTCRDPRQQRYRDRALTAAAMRSPRLRLSTRACRS